MSKKKRVRRDIEKFARTGRWWDLLRLLESEGLIRENAAEHQGAWKAVVKRALQQEKGFEEFSREMETLRTFPNTPDFHLLMGIKGVVQGRCAPGEVLGLEGLSSDGARLRSNLADFASSAGSDAKLRAMLDKFRREPEKITRRYFGQVADHLPEHSLKAAVRRMGELIAHARRFNGKAAVARGWDAVEVRRLESMDRQLQIASRALPNSLREILLHPFVHNIAVMCRRLAPDAVAGDAARMVRAIPFLLPRLAGDRLAEVEKELLIHESQCVSQGGQGLDTLRRRLEGLDIEEKLSILRNLRLGIQRRASKERDFGFPDFFDEDPYEKNDDLEDWDDEDTDHELAASGAPQSRAMARSLLMVHHSVLRDIASRLPDVSHRDRKELVRVMEPILLQDMDYILNVVQSSDDFISLLSAVITASCGGTRTALLGIVGGAHLRNTDLRKMAETLLGRSDPPTPDDMDWLASDWGDLIYPRPRSLKPLLDRYSGDKGLLKAFPAKLCAMLELDLVEAALKSRFPGFSSIPGIALGIQEPNELRTLGRELEDLAEFDLFEPVRHYLRCYAKVGFTIEGHLCWFNGLRTRCGTKVWDYILEDVKRYSRVTEMTDDLAMGKGVETPFAERVEATILFMTEHLDELATLPMEVLGPLLEVILGLSRIRPSQHTLLIRLEKLLAEKFEAGEEAAQPFMQRIKRTLRALAGTKTHRQKTRKPRR